MSPVREPMSPEAVKDIVATIEQGWKAAIEAIREAEELRTAALRGQYERLARRFVVMTVVLVISLSAGLVAFGAQLHAQGDVVRTQGRQGDRLSAVVRVQQRQRRIALIDRCRQTNDLTTGLRTFVRHVAPDLLPLAERTFRVEPNCARYAQRILTAKRAPTPPQHR